MNIYFWIIAFMQVASSEWVLGLQVFSFENFYNAEKNGSKYCCCGAPSTCTETITALHSMCKQECNTYFAVHLQDCKSGLSCNTIKRFNFSGDNGSPSALSSLVFQIPFGLSTQDDQVRIK